MKSIYTYGQIYLREGVPVSLRQLPPPPFTGLLFLQGKFGACFKNYFVISFLSLLGKIAYVFKCFNL